MKKKTKNIILLVLIAVFGLNTILITTTVVNGKSINSSSFVMNYILLLFFILLYCITIARHRKEQKTPTIHTSLSNNKTLPLEQSIAQGNSNIDLTNQSITAIKNNSSTSNNISQNIDKKQKRAHILTSISIAIFVFQIPLSIIANINIRDTSIPWTEGRVFNYFYVVANYGFLFITFILNIISFGMQLLINNNQSKAKSSAYIPIILSWLLWVLLFILTVLLESY